MFKGKILSTYFPDRYLNVFSDEHLNFYLNQFNIDTPSLISGDAIYKKERLLEFKNDNSIMKTWSTDLFSHFLYNYYPRRKPKVELQSTHPILSEYTPLLFHDNQILTSIELLIIPPSTKSRSSKAATKNPDYEKQMRRNKEIGNRGEKLVIDWEKAQLIKDGYPDIAEMVEKRILDSDGYDILSYEIDGTPKYIEVKTTTLKVGNGSFFLSSNELDKATKFLNYHLYIVFEIQTANPKLWKVGNPFEPSNEHIVITPVAYQVQITTLLKQKTT